MKKRTSKRKREENKRERNGMPSENKQNRILNSWIRLERTSSTDADLYLWKPDENEIPKLSLRAHLWYECANFLTTHFAHRFDIIVNHSANVRLCFANCSNVSLRLPYEHQLRQSSTCGQFNCALHTGSTVSDRLHAIRQRVSGF